MPKESEKSPDIFQLLTETAKKERRKTKLELLAPLKIEEIFQEGSITINKKTCQGVECKLCIKVCPTNALFWRAGEVGIIEALCVYCGACVLSCIVDDCITIRRKRASGEVEEFSNPKDFMLLQNGIEAKKRLERIKEVFPSVEGYLRQYRKKKTRKKRARKVAK